MTTKVLIIGLDGGTYDLLRPLTEQGFMPNLARVLEEGCWGDLESTIPPFTAAAWSTFATGKNPGQHGILSFQKFDRFDYHEKATGFNDARQIRQPLWERLSEAGKRVAVINVPLSYPPRPVNGMMITGMMTPAKAENFTYPADLAADLSDYMIDVNFVRDEDSFRRYGLPDKQEMLAEIQMVTQRRTAVCLERLEQESWDFFMVVYTGTDRVSHFFWDDLAPVWRGHSLTDFAPDLTKLLHYFQQLDQDIGSLMAAAGSAAQVLFMSDHGFGASPTKRFSINVWLERQNLLALRQSKMPTNLDYWRMKVGRTPFLKNLLRYFLSQETQDKLAQKASEGNDGSIEWAKTQAYFVPIYFFVCGIELNTVGAHRQGVVPIGEAYEALRSHIIDAVQQVRDPSTGSFVVETAVRREALYSGPYVSEFPDIILVLNPDYVGSRSLASSQLVEPYTPFRAGEHRAAGIFAAIGSYIQPKAGVPKLKLEDMAATVLYLLGEPVPSSFDGRIITEAIDSDYLEANPPKYTHSNAEEVNTVSEMLHSADDEVDLIERLRSLGYLE